MKQSKVDIDAGKVQEMLGRDRHLVSSTWAKAKVDGSRNEIACQVSKLKSFERSSGALWRSKTGELMELTRVVDPFLLKI